MTPEEVADTLSRFINMSTSDTKQLARHITQDHRTLQQDTFKMFLLCIEEWQKYYRMGVFDDRNVWTCKTADRIMRMLDEEQG